MKMDSSTSAITNPDSFRDPEGFVFVSGSKILRALWPKGLESYRALRESSLAESLEKDNLLVRSWEVDREGWRNFGPLPEGIAGILEQTKIPLITFPFEWSFDMLRDAALLHIDLLLRAGQKGYFLNRLAFPQRQIYCVALHHRAARSHYETGAIANPDNSPHA